MNGRRLPDTTILIRTRQIIWTVLRCCSLGAVAGPSMLIRCPAEPLHRSPDPASQWVHWMSPPLLTPPVHEATTTPITRRDNHARWPAAEWSDVAPEGAGGRPARSISPPGRGNPGDERRRPARWPAGIHDRRSRAVHHHQRWSRPGPLRAAKPPNPERWRAAGPIGRGPLRRPATTSGTGCTEGVDGRLKHAWRTSRGCRSSSPTPDREELEQRRAQLAHAVVVIAPPLNSSPKGVWSSGSGGGDDISRARSRPATSLVRVAARWPA